MNKISFSKQLVALIIIVATLLVPVACSSTSTPASTTSTSRTPSNTTTSPTTTSTTTTSTTTSPAYTVMTSSKSGIGDYLVDGKGMTLYYFTKDSVGKSTATAAILQNWPIFNPANFTVPASLNAADFGTITRDDGQKIATYKGWPLYYYAKDLAPGDTLGQGVGNIWFVINPGNFPPSPTPTSTTTTTPAPTTSTSTSTPPVSTTPGAAVTIDLMAQNMAFDKSTITVTAGASVTINFNNKDGGIPHNFALYMDSTASTPIFVGQTITGPATIVYTFAAPATPGTYFFRCDVHPTQMTGQFIVQ